MRNPGPRVPRPAQRLVSRCQRLWAARSAPGNRRPLSPAGLPDHARSTHPVSCPPILPTADQGLITDVLIERAGFLASLEGLLRETAASSGRLVFLGGEAGVGKTALATALAEAAEGPMVRRGSCDSVTTAEPLGPILDALPELVATVDQDAGASRL